MKISWAAGIVILALLAAGGLASSQPSPSRVSYVGTTLEDAHFQIYEEVRPLLIQDYAALAAMCDNGEAARASTVK